MEQRQRRASNDEIGSAAIRASRSIRRDQSPLAPIESSDWSASQSPRSRPVGRYGRLTGEDDKAPNPRATVS
jgi:hypothetical protein